jgi:hypothetical protein
MHIYYLDSNTTIQEAQIKRDTEFEFLKFKIEYVQISILTGELEVYLKLIEEE